MLILILMMVASNVAFDVDGMLGALAKWLRIVGFDAAFPCHRPGPGRFFVTAARFKQYATSVIVTAAAPLEQLREVLEQTEVILDPNRLLSRCLICNEPVVTVSHEQVAGRIPEQIRARRFTTRQCPACGRIYWQGSHHRRIVKRLETAGFMGSP